MPTPLYARTDFAGKPKPEPEPEPESDTREYADPELVQSSTYRIPGVDPDPVPSSTVSLPAKPEPDPVPSSTISLPAKPEPDPVPSSTVSLPAKKEPYPIEMQEPDHRIIVRLSPQEQREALEKFDTSEYEE